MHETIIQLVNRNPGITDKELREQLGKERKEIYRQMKALVDNKLVRKAPNLKDMRQFKYFPIIGDKGEASS